VLAGIVRLASLVSGARCAAVHILDEDHQNRIAGHGVRLGVEPLEGSMSELVLHGGATICVADATENPRLQGTAFAHGGEPVRFLACVALTSAGGELLGTLCAFDTRRIELGEAGLAGLEELARQVSAHLEMVDLISDLGAAATRDPLTGVANRLILEDRLRHLIARRTIRDHPLVVAMVDLDDFKEINDRHGHATGDHVLRTVALSLTKAVRPEDTVARLGGDEFVVCAQLGAHDLAEKFRARLQSAASPPIRLPGLQLLPSATVGLASAVDADSADAILERADQDLYRRKQRRREQELPPREARG